MAAVTQRIPNFLGGVSQQADDLKFLNQLKDCKNGYPEPTLGLIKRPGCKFFSELKNSGGTIYGPTTFNNGKWFSIFRDQNEQYVCVIYGTTIRVWSLIDGTEKTVSYGANATNYLTGTKDDYDVLTINDYTFITNKNVAVTTQAAPSYNFKRRATIRLLSVEYAAKYEVSVTVSGVTTTKSYTTFNAEDTISSPSQTVKTVTGDAILDDLVTQLNTISNFTATKIGSSIELTNSASAFDIAIKAGADNDAMYVYQDEADNIARLASRATHNRLVKIVNTAGNNADDYWVKFIATNGVSGIGYWEEDRDPTVSPGLTASTMPHQLIRNTNGTFTFQQSTWEDRLVGDNETNSHPSFVGSTIKKLFFYNNRFGVLTEDNVSMSQAGDFFNFYHNSALTVIDSDPVDVNCSSIRPATLYAVLPVAQGLVLFSRTQQFLLTGVDSVLTPGGTTIKTIANYEVDTLNSPVDMGTTIAFISKTPSYSRVFEMVTQGQEQSPIVSDITRSIPEYIPSTVDQVISSPQNSLLSVGSTSSKTLFLFKFYSSGDKREFQSWVKWELPGQVLHHVVNEDVVWAVTKQQNSCVIHKLPLVQSPSTSTFLTSDGSRVDPRLDMWSAPASTTYNTTPNDEHTRVYLPFKHDSTLTLCVVTANPNAVTPTYSNSGQVYFPQVLLDGGNYYAKIPNTDLTAESLIVGYTYDMDYYLPKLFFRQGEGGNITDWSATLTIARMKFLFGLGGDVTFKIKAKGRSEWVDTQGVRNANYYLANDIPFVNTTEYNVPVHQRSENYEFRIYSNSPFPVSLLSMTWEGNYSPKYYRRS